MRKIGFFLALTMMAGVSIQAQNWTDREGRTVGERSGGSRYYTVDKGAVTQRLAAWLRTHTSQEGGNINCTSDLKVSLSVQDASTHTDVTGVRKGEELELVVDNASGKRLFFAVAFVDESEQWSVVSIDNSDKSFELAAGDKRSLTCSLDEKVASGKGHFMLLAYTEPFSLRKVVDKYLAEFLYERNVKAGAAIVPVVVN